MTRIKTQSKPIGTPPTATRPLSLELSRRQTVIGLLAFSVIALLCSLGRIFKSFLYPPQPVNTYGGVVNVGPLMQFPAAGSPPKLVPHGRFWLTHTDNGISALHSSCTHLECLFSWDPEQQMFVCPCHGSAFSIDGQVIRGPAQRALDRFPVRLVQVDGTLVRDFDTNVMAVGVADLLGDANSRQEAETQKTTATPIQVQVDTGQKIVMR